MKIFLAEYRIHDKLSKKIAPLNNLLQFILHYCGRAERAGPFSKPQKLQKINLAARVRLALIIIPVVMNCFRSSTGQNLTISA